VTALPDNTTRCGEVSCCISSPGAWWYSPERFGGSRSCASLIHRVSLLDGLRECILSRYDMQIMDALREECASSPLPEGSGDPEMDKD
jgi:hypothetical protein